MFILSGAYLLLNAASYDGEILHAHSCRPYAGHVFGFMSMDRRYKNNDIFSKCVYHVGVDFCSGDLRQWVDRWDRRQ